MMPVVVGMSEAVIAMRSMDSAAAGVASASEPAKARHTGRSVMVLSCQDLSALKSSKKRASGLRG